MPRGTWGSGEHLSCAGVVCTFGGVCTGDLTQLLGVPPFHRRRRRIILLLEPLPLHVPCMHHPRMRGLMPCHRCCASLLMHSVRSVGGLLPFPLCGRRCIARGDVGSHLHSMLYRVVRISGNGSISGLCKLSTAAEACAG